MERDLVALRGAHVLETAVNPVAKERRNALHDERSGEVRNDPREEFDGVGRGRGELHRTTLVARREVP